MDFNFVFTNTTFLVNDSSLLNNTEVAKNSTTSVGEKRGISYFDTAYFIIVTISTVT